MVDIVVRNREPTLQGAVGGVLDGLLDVLVAGGLLDAAGQVHNGDVRGRDAHRHAGKLAIKVRDDLADGLGSTGAARDDVLSSRTAASPVLGGGAIDGLLSGGVGMDSGHESLDDLELVVDGLGKRGQAVGGARGVGDDGSAAVVRLLVNAHDVHGGIGRGSGDDNPLGATLQMGLGLLGGGEDTSGLDDVLSAGVLPGDGGRIPLGVELDLLAVDNQIVAIDGDVGVEDAVGGVILEHVLLNGRLRPDTSEQKTDQRRQQTRRRRREAGGSWG